MPVSEEESAVSPLKCSTCKRAMSTPLVCDYCHSVNPCAISSDHFELLGIEPAFDIDLKELQRKFIALSRHAHPDFHSGESEEVQKLHMQVSAALNNAYGTLKDPAERAAYLLKMLGGKTSAEDQSVSQSFLETMMMLQEELVDAKGDGDSGEMDRLRDVLRTQHDGLMKCIGELFDKHRQAVSCRAVSDELLGELRQCINSVSYVKKLIMMAE